MASVGLRLKASDWTLRLRLVLPHPGEGKIRKGDAGGGQKRSERDVFYCCNAACMGTSHLPEVIL